MWAEPSPRQRHSVGDLPDPEISPRCAPRKNAQKSLEHRVGSATGLTEIDAADVAEQPSKTKTPFSGRREFVCASGQGPFHCVPSMTDRLEVEVLPPA
jgi:hypothetical protein